MSSSILLNNEYKNKAQYNKLHVEKIKTDNLFVDNNFLDKHIENLEYVGINMKPCEYCKNFKGIHYHNIDKNYLSIGDNYIDNKHACLICKENKGKLHIHLKQ